MTPRVSGDRINNSVMMFLDPASARYVANAMIDAIRSESTEQGTAHAQAVLEAVNRVLGSEGIAFVQDEISA